MAAEVRDKAWQAHEGLQRERDKAVDEVTTLKTMIEEMSGCTRDSSLSNHAFLIDVQRPELDVAGFYRGFNSR
jgi:hypothetical protein